ncbi:MAG: cytochrome c biogenesis protein CcsA [Alphaproteobacteria bacterium]
MAKDLLFSLAALACLFPAALAPLRADSRPDVVFWGSLGLSILGPVAWSVMEMSVGWHTGLSITLWVCIVASLLVFAGMSWGTRQSWRLAPLLFPYLIGLGIIATIWRQAMGHGLAEGAPARWVKFHILTSVATYGLLTVAAVAALACFLQERALKTKRPNTLTRMLPPVADSEFLLGRLLLTSEIVLGLGLVSGVALQYMEAGVIFRIGHKTLLSLMAFVLIGLLLLARRVIGVRGRMAARMALLAYLLLTLAYPGVKFVTDVLLGR